MNTRILMAEEGEGGTGAGGGTGTETAAPATFDTIIPQEFKDKAYLNDLKTLPVGPDGFSALFKKLDGAQTLIGKKTGVPSSDAPPEEWEKFHAQIRPAKAEEYELPAPPEGTAGMDPEAMTAIKGMFHEAGLTKSQAAKLATKFDAFVMEKAGAQAAESAKLDKEFEEMTKAAFGAENAKVLDRSRELLQALTPDNMKPYLNRLPNESLTLIAGLMESVRAKFMKEDRIDGGGQGAATDVSSLREQARALQSSEAWKDTFHKDHEATKRKVGELYTAIGRAGGA